ncbi:hypothetical protein DENIS_3311 [Desulfonema ishimotonii]|uniref:Tetratricopeptide repeat protein n=1 Tax=Desulfonema ishimotonii TaxID=45657 RepID=A0A401FZC0_9BACT|nr:tetratricopeptide repeat protein [Desulfonema ishimotonii]GBC62342.1 hypothetical protein DENIS_3311 [Desulfonema ishimotonii]
MYRITRILLALLWLATPAPLYAGRPAEKQQMTRNEQQALYAAQEAMKKEDFGTARQVLQNHLRNHPNEAGPLFYYALGNAWYMGGKAKPAYDAYKKGFQIDPTSCALCLNLGRVAYELEKYQTAGGLFEKAHRLGKGQKNPDLLYQAGVAYYQGKSLKNAKRVLKRLVSGKRRPDKSCLQLLIQVHLDLKEWKSAEKIVRDFLKQEQENTEYWQLLAQIRMRREDYRGAASALEIIYSLRKPTSKELEELANLYFYLNVPLKAVRTLERAYGPAPKPAHCEKLARAAVQAQQPDRAIRYLNMAIGQTPASKYHLEKGRIYYEQGRWNEATTSLRICVRQNPKQAAAQILLGYCLMEKGAWAEARTVFLAAEKDQKYRKEARDALAMLKEISEAADQ